MKNLTFKIRTPEKGDSSSFITDITNMMNTVNSLINTYLDSETDIDNSIKIIKELNNTVQDSISSISEFQNTSTLKKINQIMNWSTTQRNIPEERVINYVLSSLYEVSMNHNRWIPINCSVGDVVECHYGKNLYGEINGRHPAIVCDILNDNMVYLVPIINRQDKLTSRSFLIINDSEDIIYNIPNYHSQTALLDKSRYVRLERLNSIIGKTSPEFFEKVINNLATTFDFRNLVSE